MKLNLIFVTSSLQGQEGVRRGASKDICQVNGGGVDVLKFRLDEEVSVVEWAVLVGNVDRARPLFLLWPP